MTFETTLLSAVCLFCAAASVAHLFGMLTAKIRGVPAGGRFFAFCIFLSVAVALYTVLIFLRQNLLWFVPLYTEAEPARAVVFSLWAVAGLFIGMHWKIFLPVCMAVYLLATVLTALLLYRVFGKPVSQYTLTISEATLKIDDTVIPHTAAEPQDVRFVVLRVSDTLLLPLPRFWYDLADAVDVSRLPATPWFVWYLSHIVSSSSEAPLADLAVPLPQDTLLPALYTLRLYPRGNNMDYTLEKTL